MQSAKHLYRGWTVRTRRFEMAKFRKLNAHNRVMRISKSQWRYCTTLRALSNFLAGVTATALTPPAESFRSTLKKCLEKRDGDPRFTCLSAAIHQKMSMNDVVSSHKSLLPLWLRMGPWALMFSMAMEKRSMFFLDRQHTYFNRCRNYTGAEC